MSLNNPSIVKAANEALVAVRPSVNIWKAFTADYSNEFATAGASVKVPVVATGDLSAFNATSNNFESGDGSITWVDVKLDDSVKATFAIDSIDKLNMPVSNYLDAFVKASKNSIQKYVSGKLAGLVNTTDITDTYTLTGDLTKKKIAQLRSECDGMPEEYNLVLKPDMYNEALALFDDSVYGSVDPIKEGKFDGLFGFHSVICGYGLGEGINGALIPVDGVAVASRPFAVADERAYIEYGIAQDEETGFGVAVMLHGSPANGGAFLNIACRFGVKLTQPTKCVVLTNS